MRANNAPGEWASIAAPLLAALCACSLESADDVEVRRATIAGGESDSTDPAVVAVVACDGPCAVDAGGRPASPREYCSGVLVGPRLVLTARHCLAPLISDDGQYRCESTRFGAPVAASNLAVASAPFASPYDGDGAIWKAVRRVDVVPGDGYCGHDVAALVLAREMSGVTPLVPSSDAPPAVGDRYAAIGFGRATPDERMVGQRRRLDGLMVSCLGNSCPAAPDGAPSAGDGEFGGQYGACPGDSGGPALAGDGRVLGLLGHGNDTCEAPIYERLDVWNAWLKTVIATATVSIDDTGGCAVAVVPRSSPSTWVVILLMTIGVLLLRGRRFSLFRRRFPARTR